MYCPQLIVGLFGFLLIPDVFSTQDTQKRLMMGGGKDLKDEFYSQNLKKRPLVGGGRSLKDLMNDKRVMFGGQNLKDLQEKRLAFGRNGDLRDLESLNKRVMMGSGRDFKNFGQ